MKDSPNYINGNSLDTNTVYLKSLGMKLEGHDVENLQDVEIKEQLLDPRMSKSEKSDHIKTVEELYSALGDPGLFAKVVFSVTCLNMLSIASNHASGVFLDYNPDHVCHAFEKNVTLGLDSSENASLAALPLSVDSSRIIYSRCQTTIVSKDYGNITRQCRQGQWSYDVDRRESSSITEWDLVCGRSNMAALSSTLYFCGVMVGGLLFGYLSDLMGRKVAILLSLYSVVGLGAGISFTHNLVVYIVLRAFMGVAVQGFLTSTYIRMLELFGPKYRGFAGNTMYCFWGIALNYLGFMAWMLKDWRLIQLACILQAVLGVFYMWLIPESLRWLVAKGKVKKANILTDRIYRMNKCGDRRCVDPSLIPRLTEGKTSKTASILELFRNSSLIRQTAISCYVTLAVNMGYWGLTYNTQALVGNRYQNFVLSTIPEIFVYLINIFVMNRFGRKRPMMFYFTVTALCCLISCLLSTTYAHGTTAIMVVSTIGRLSACGLMGTNDVFMAELFPTLVRNTGVGVCVCVGRVGAVITPIIFSLTTHTFRWLPLLSFGLVTALAVFLTMLLPDTWKRDLPETLTDFEMTVVVDEVQEPGKEALLLTDDSHVLEKTETVNMAETA